MNDILLQLYFLELVGYTLSMNLSKFAPTGAAFLLAQLGAHAADRFAERIKVLGIAPPHAGILRLIAATPSYNQLSLGKKLGLFPSRMVILIDQLVDKGLVERKRSETDRRQSTLVLTKKGAHLLERLSGLAAEHEAELCAALTVDERNTLASLCSKIATEQGLTPKVHPGYRKLKP
ncbi:MAG TPA: MarR family transcriptional regulator [Verrucomicrobiae bacterium]|jgi:DNA-binding MarR family transcriptional regulator|nr:MarR family transcriptional regulator [Verrucomicrobiae bacterium]